MESRGETETGTRGQDPTVRNSKTCRDAQYVMSYFVAGISAALGDKDKAFAELERVVPNAIGICIA